MLDCNIFPGLGRDYLETEVNLFLLPQLENEGEDALTRGGLRTTRVSQERYQHVSSDSKCKSILTA